MAFILKYSLKVALVMLVFFLLVSCYSVRIVSTKGAPMPTEQFDRDDWYRDKMVVEIDTIIKAGITVDDITFRVLKEGCETGKLFSVEYKNTFGGSLLYLVTFGNKRKVKLKYVCMKPEN
ncbi:hypothetical protein LX77_01010 [Gelidibacter algens]|jgi:hypothetical protein|uniref:Lipoprotein n=1 Tax=Gelidibacter algens TaxID=49280 RepID=A0A1A7R1X1_9FLAO|nr:hypothetical protein [Gelidibacter algens]OBX24777.1 hypothetical protein A9996_13360 [Gelidibacter algens]RAJ26755.1 hypothetical protein LX77_01010 [Gelidibacter algens]